MSLDKVTPKVSAYELATLLIELFGKDVRLSSTVKNGEYFSFETGNQTIYCSDESIERIAASERGGGVEVASHHNAIMGLCDQRMGDISECVHRDVLYCAFCICHELGHYEQAFEWGQSELERRGSIREKQIYELNERMQKLADAGFSPECVYSCFANQYRQIPVEQDADERAIRMLKSLLAADSFPAQFRVEE